MRCFLWSILIIPFLLTACADKYYFVQREYSTAATHDNGQHGKPRWTLIEDIYPISDDDEDEDEKQIGWTISPYCPDGEGVRCGTIDDFTKDENGNLPSERRIAEERFERRKDFVINYYESGNDKGSAGKAIKQILMLPIQIMLIPVALLQPYYEDYCYHHPDKCDNKSDSIQIQNNKYRIIYEETMLEYIKKDMEYERSNILKQ